MPIKAYQRRESESRAAEEGQDLKYIRCHRNFQDGKITLGELYVYLRPEVFRQAKKENRDQEPQLSPPGRGALEGPGAGGGEVSDCLWIF